MLVIQLENIDKNEMMCFNVGICETMSEIKSKAFHTTQQAAG